MRPPAILAVFVLAGAGSAQVVPSRCLVGVSLLNRLREDLTPETSDKKLAEFHASSKDQLRACPDNPDLWYFRFLMAERLKDPGDAALARQQAAERHAPLLTAQANPLREVREAAVALPPKIGEKYALVVGINQFKSTSGLRFAVNDAISVADLLANPQVGRFNPSKVTTLTDDKATLTGFRTAIGEIRAKVHEEDLVVVYIASHGSPRGMDPNGVSYVIMHDTKADTQANLYATSLQMIDLVDMLQRDMKAKRVVLLLDTCYSGEATGVRGMRVYSPNQDPQEKADFSKAADRFVDRTAAGAARVFISASRGGEKSLENESLHHGYFTYYLLEALKKDNGHSELGEVFQSVHDHTAEAVRSTGLTQTPTMRNTPEGLRIVIGAPEGR